MVTKKKVKHPKQYSGGKAFTEEELYLRSQGYSDQNDPEINAMIENLRSSESDYVRFLQKERDLLPLKPEKEEKIDTMFHQYMTMQILRPLMKGLSVDSVLSSAGMFVGFYLADPKVGKQFEKQLILRVDKTLNEASKADPTGLVGKLRGKFHSIIGEDRVPMTPDKAAAQEIGFLRNAYRLMREPDADVTQIQIDYEAAVATVRKKALIDGISKDDIVKQRNCMIGRMIEKHPEDIKYFSELFSGDVHKSPYQMKRLNKEGHMMPYYVWDGQFSNADGTPYDGDFSPRLPYEPEFHYMQSRKCFDEKIVKCKTDKERIEYFFTTGEELASYKTQSLYTSSDDMRLLATAMADDMPPAEMGQMLFESMLNTYLDYSEAMPEFGKKFQKAFNDYKSMKHQNVYDEASFTGRWQAKPDWEASGKEQISIIDGSERRERKYDNMNVSEDLQDAVASGKMSLSKAEDTERKVLTDSKHVNIPKHKLYDTDHYKEWEKKYHKEMRKKVMAKLALLYGAKKVASTKTLDDDIAFEKTVKPRIEKLEKDKTADEDSVDLELSKF